MSFVLLFVLLSSSAAIPLMCASPRESPTEASPQATPLQTTGHGIPLSASPSLGDPPGVISKSCRLSKGACSVAFKPIQARSPVTISAVYLGDKNNPQSAGVFQLNVTVRATKTSVVCRPLLLATGAAFSCTARVTGLSPQGNASWSQAGLGSVSFGAVTCALVNGKCTVVLSAVSAGKVSIQAAYQGDLNNAPGSGQKTVNIVTHKLRAKS